MDNNNNDEVTVTKAKGKRGRQALISTEKFVELWTNASSLNEVVSQLGLDREASKARIYASMRASILRRQGVALKQFQRGRPKKTVKVLAE